MLTVDVVSDPAAFAALKDDWNTLADRFATPLHRFEWFEAGWNAFGEGRKLATFVVRDGERVRAIAPLMVERASGFPRLIVIGNETAEPNAILYADDESLAALTNGIMRHRVPLWLNRVRDDSSEMRSLQSATGARRGPFFANPRNTATARISVVEPWADFEKRMTAQSRQTLRRKLRMAERSGSVRLEVVAPDLASVDNQLQQVFEVESGGWKGRNGTAILSDPQIHRFYSEYGRKAAELGILRLHLLWVDDTLAAVRMAVEVENTLWELKIGYDEQFAKWSPGVVLTHETIRHAFEHGLSGLEFLGRAEYWQRHWPVETEACSAIRYYPLSISSIAALTYDSWDLLARRIAAKWSPQRRRFLKQEEFTDPS